MLRAIVVNSIDKLPIIIMIIMIKIIFRLYKEFSERIYVTKKKKRRRSRKRKRERWREKTNKDGYR